jgi:hypothetical protein
MSTDRDIARIVRSWLEDGATALPDRVLDTVLDQLPTTSQRRAWWPAWRFREMNTFAKFAIAAAAVVLVAFVGIRLLPSQGNVGGSLPSASPSPSPSQTAAPLGLRQGPLSPGRYILGPAQRDSFLECPKPSVSTCTDTMRLIFTVPDGWSGILDSIWLTDVGNASPAGAGLLFARGAPLHTDPCLTEAAIASDGTMVVPDIPVGPTADEFATALAEHPLLDVTTPVDVTLAGYSGKYVDLQVPSDISACSADYRPWEPGLYAQGSAQRWHLWILDVAGERVVVQSTDYAGTSEQHRAELQAIVDSVQIEP